MGRQNNRQVWDALVMVLQFGTSMIVSLVLCTFAGIWIGQKTGTTWPVIVGFFVGALAGCTSIYKMAKRLIHSDQKKKDSEKRYQDIKEKNVKKIK